ncbi:Predicted acetyltransferase [Paenibacillus sp. UNCCL117]|uniref:GNAT family N-acetyltransferase n=1 Tax=unclassified Paenibacillus TaxID=185978 RepID=UPI00088E509F|nr:MULTISPECIES: GNAT family N-acetyltransferase [unclassified Paenibacillus]SDC63794.1 Predicted acetyltransferase [Paenibacillus sp. cl123]SFW22380.1 Predicted acetyltransferase [Paenibacillus sp. UNCCL117]
MTDQIRLLKPEEASESLALSEFAFQRKVAPEKREGMLADMRAEQTWGYFVEDRLAAKLTVLELETWIHGKAYGMGGIASVATWPEYRRQGMVGKLLSRALQAMKERGQDLSFLAPFSYAFYRKYGWEASIDYIRYELPAGRLPKPDLREGSRVARIEADAAELNPIYAAYAQRFNGMLKRTEAWWRKRIFQAKQGIVNLYVNPAGEPEGYIFYEVKEKVFTVHELAALTEDARRGIWRFIANHDSMIDRVVYHAPVGDPLPYLLEEPRIKQEIVPYFMARIVNVESFLRRYAFAGGESGGSPAAPFYLQIMDAQAGWNNGAFRIRPGIQGANEVVKLPAGAAARSELGEDGGPEVIACDIQTLSSLLMGYKPALLLHRIGRLRGSENEIARLQQYLPEQVPYLTDYF